MNKADEVGTQTEAPKRPRGNLAFVEDQRVDPVLHLHRRVLIRGMGLGGELNGSSQLLVFGRYQVWNF